jgi:NCAIR mutase (PurE)-related protein
MDRKRLKKLLEGVQKGSITPEDAIDELRSLPFEDLGYAKLDHHRTIRRGFPEAVFCIGKSNKQIIEIARRFVERQGFAVLTKVSEEQASEVRKKLDGRRMKYSAKARMILIGKPSERIDGTLSVVTAGTSDIPIAEEAAVLCEAYGVRIKRIYDIGVAGTHRLAPFVRAIDSSDVVIVVAGMEGALPSVVASTTDKPVIAVPTSIGYGASFRGLAALLGMLCSCSPGIAITNIDNGFGAGVFALSIMRLRNGG